MWGAYRMKVFLRSPATIKIGKKFVQLVCLGKIQTFSNDLA